MPSEKSKAATWTTGSRTLPTVELELESGFAVKAGNAGWKSTSKVHPTVVLEPMEASCVQVQLTWVKAENGRTSPIQIQLTWVKAENGRTSPIQNGRYVPTARFAGEVEQFSVVLEIAEGNTANPTKGTLRLLNPDLAQIQRRIRPGVALEIMEGGRVVANCMIESLDSAAVVAKR